MRESRPCFESRGGVIPADSDAAVVVDPGVRPFDLPATLVLSGGKAANRPSLLRLRSFQTRAGIIG